MRLALAFRAFFAVLFRKDAAERIGRSLDQAGALEPAAPSLPPSRQPEEKPARSAGASGTGSGGGRNDALTLLMVLQRDARFLDLVNESLDGYTDAQIGSAARPALQETRKTLQRLFGLEKASAQPEGESIEIPGHASPIRYRVTGNASAHRGRVTHEGWLATKVDLPKWTGNRDDAMVLAPIEVEAGS